MASLKVRRYWPAKNKSQKLKGESKINEKDNGMNWKKDGEVGIARKLNGRKIKISTGDNKDKNRDFRKSDQR